MFIKTMLEELSVNKITSMTGLGLEMKTSSLVFASTACSKQGLSLFTSVGLLYVREITGA